MRKLHKGYLVYATIFKFEKIFFFIWIRRLYAQTQEIQLEPKFESVLSESSPPSQSESTAPLQPDCDASTTPKR